MNNVLELKGQFEYKSREGRPPMPSLPSSSRVKTERLSKLLTNLTELKKYWTKEDIIKGSLISVYYVKIAAKTNRIQELLNERGTGRYPSDTVVGAKYNDSRTKHIITHYVSKNAINNSILKLEKSIKILNEEYDGQIDDITFKDMSRVNKIKFEKYGISKTSFRKVIQDAYYVEKFDVEFADVSTSESSIVTLYDIGEDAQELLDTIGVYTNSHRYLDKNTVLLYKDELALLYEKAGYLISMSVVDFTKLSPIKSVETDKEVVMSIPKPKDEPIIGVIDTLFDENVYFSDWVEYKQMIDDNIPISSRDKEHGTSVSSIIVDGPSINPDLNDGCGRFRVRHFGVSTADGFNSFTIIKRIKEIVEANPEVKVWNLSLGSIRETSENFVSAEAAILDKIQFEKDIIFVIAGTNKRPQDQNKRIGAPADSLNSLVVNSVDSKNRPTDYTRKGIVLSYYTKPDISYYGGSEERSIRVCSSTGEKFVEGTSYAAPWISRKLAYLIKVIGLSTEVAKALIIDSAISWNPVLKYEDTALLGHGVVPIKIEDIISSKTDEIKFVISGTSENDEAYNYRLPVPIDNNKYPYVARATMCYFPKCTRSQGVDYTNTELDIQFGRIDDKGKIKPLNGNKQGTNDPNYYLYEDDARSEFGKWNNVKFISEKIAKSPVGKKVYEHPMWGLSIKSYERLFNRDGNGIRFGLVITLKEINGVNRIEEFIQQCSLNGWLVNRIDVEQRIDIYQTVQETIELE